MTLKSVAKNVKFHEFHELIIIVLVNGFQFVALRPCKINAERAIASASKLNFRSVFRLLVKDSLLF